MEVSLRVRDFNVSLSEGLDNRYAQIGLHVQEILDVPQVNVQHKIE